MKPKIEGQLDGQSLVTEIPLKLIFHTKQRIIVDLWDIENDEPTTTELDVCNVRSGTHLLSIKSIDKDIEVNGRQFRSMKTFLDMMGLQASGSEIRKWLLDGYHRFGSSEWVRCCLLSASIHGLCNIKELSTPKDKLLIQSHSEAWLKPDGMFIYPKAKLLNQYFELVKSNKRFTKRYVRHKII